MAAELRASVHPSSTVTAIDPQHKRVLVNGQPLSYGKLVLALSADPMRLPLAGNGTDSVLSVNDLDDYRHFRSALAGKQDVAILGAGLIGCEFANDLAAAGYRVQVIDLAPQLLGRLLSPAAAYLLRRLEADGIGFHLGTATQRVGRLGQRLALSLSDGATIEADVVLSAVGLRPRVALARAAGIEANRGIVLNGYLQTSADSVYALGDCAEVEGRVLPFVMPIMHAARALAATLAGKPTPVHYPAMPVTVKTPSCPAVVSPPDLSAPGAWHIDSSEGGVGTLFRNAAGELLGFALLGDATAEKNTLAAKLPAMGAGY